MATAWGLSWAPALWLPTTLHRPSQVVYWILYLLVVSSCGHGQSLLGYSGIYSLTTHRNFDSCFFWNDRDGLHNPTRTGHAAQATAISVLDGSDGCLRTLLCRHNRDIRFSSRTGSALGCLFRSLAI